MEADEYGLAREEKQVSTRVPRLPPADAVKEAVRRINRAQAAANQTLAMCMRLVAKKGPPFFDAREFRPHEDYVVPNGVEFNPTEDEFEESWLTEDASRLVLLYRAIAERVEFCTSPKGIVTVRVHFF